MNEHYQPKPEQPLRAQEVNAAKEARQCLADQVGVPIELSANGVRNALLGSALNPDILTGRCVGEVAQAVLAVFIDHPNLRNEMRRSLAFDIEALEHGDSATQQKALVMILKGHHGYGLDDRLLDLLQNEFAR